MSDAEQEKNNIDWAERSDLEDLGLSTFEDVSVNNLKFCELSFFLCSPPASFLTFLTPQELLK
jgi:hypothetical protein